MTDDTAYFESKEFKDILRKYEESVESGHAIYMDADDLADIADYYQYHNRQEEACQAVNLALEFNPDAVGPLLFKGREALFKNDFDTAKTYAERILAADYLEGLYFQGEMMICEGHIEEADEFFREHQKDVMADEHTDYAYDVANIFSDYDAFEKAFEWIMRTKGDDSDDFKELLAHTLFGLGKYKDSERIFNELIDHNPYSSRYWNALANAQYMSEDYGAAITSSEYAIAINPDDTEGLLSKANSLYNLENYDIALSFYRKYSDKVPHDEAGYLHQGMCLINLGRYEEAIQALLEGEKAAGDASPYLSEIYQEQAFAHCELHKTEAALYYIDKAQSMPCDHVNLEVARGHILLADERLEEAERAFRKALQLSSNSERTMLRIIVSLFDNGYLHSSYHLFKIFLQHVSDDWNEGYSYMAICCLEMKKTDEFLSFIKIAAEKNPKEAKLVLSPYFPQGMAPEEYYEYMLNKIKQNEV